MEWSSIIVDIHDSFLFRLCFVPTLDTIKASCHDVSFLQYGEMHEKTVRQSES